MKNKVLVAIISVFITITVGCQSGISPDSVTVDNPATVEQIVESVMADEEAWKIYKRRARVAIKNTKK